MDLNPAFTAVAMLGMLGRGPRGDCSTLGISESRFALSAPGILRHVSSRKMNRELHQNSINSQADYNPVSGGGCLEDFSNCGLVGKLRAV